MAKKRRGRARAHSAAVAVTIDGDVLLNVACLDGSNALPALLQLAVEQPGRVFIGVVMNERERREVLEWLSDAAFEGTGFIAGRRQRRSRSRA